MRRFNILLVLRILLCVIVMLVIYAYLGGSSLDTGYSKFTAYEKCTFKMLLIIIAMNVVKSGGDLK